MQYLIQYVWTLIKGLSKINKCKFSITVNNGYIEKIFSVDQDVLSGSDQSIL